MVTSSRIPGRWLGPLAILLLALGGCGERESEAPSEAPPTPAVAVASDWAALLANHPLTVEEIEAWKVVRARLAESPPSPEAPIEGEWTLEEIAAQIEASAEAQAALEIGGLSAAEYVLTSLALLQARFVLTARRQGLIEEVPAGIDPQNVELAERYEADLEGLGPAAWNGRP